MTSGPHGAELASNRQVAIRCVVEQLKPKSKIIIYTSDQRGQPAGVGLIGRRFELDEVRQALSVIQ